MAATELKPLLTRRERGEIRRRAYAEARKLAVELATMLDADLLDLAVELGSGAAALDDEEVRRVVSRRLDRLAGDYA